MSGFAITLDRHIVDQERNHPEATGAFTALLTDISLAAKIISYNVNKGSKNNLL